MAPEGKVERIFEIRVTGGIQPGICHVSAGSSAESPEHEDIKIPEFGKWKERLDKLQEALLLAPIARRGLGSSTFDNVEQEVIATVGAPVIVQEVGEALFDLLFAKKIYAAFDRNMEAAQRSGSVLRIRLSMEAPELSYLPWEALYNTSAKQYLAPSPRTPIVRGTQSDDLDLLPPVGLPLCVLGMVPAVRSLATLNVEAEKANILKSLDALLSKQQAILGWTTSGSPSDLIERLQHPPKNCESWHVFHFIGHGGYDESVRMGYIAVDPDPSSIGINKVPENVQALYADDLRNILEISSGLRLVILNSCKGAAALPGEIFRSTAEKLILEGFTAVIAMQFEISDEAAIEFSAALYRQLALGTPIHKAVTIARMKLKQLHSPEWITPVLYMRTRDGRLFRDLAGS